VAQKKNISDAVIRRLPRYLRYLSEMHEHGVPRISSRELGERMGLTPSQIRQDFSHFGEFGQQGYGYRVGDLLAAIRHILALDQEYHMAVVGAGNIGQAIAKYRNFREHGFLVDVLFDTDPELVGKKIEGVKVLHWDKAGTYLRNHPVNIGVICVPQEAAQAAAERLVEGGVQDIWNFAPKDLSLPGEVLVENVHLSESLYALAFRSKHREITDG
jgi:redox-sensing transcriptional repressor